MNTTHTITNRFTRETIFTCSAPTFLQAVLAAIKSGANLSGANLIGANLSGANLSGANLSYAYLSGANLSDANLIGANLSCANLSGANLSDANLSCANLSCANLSGAYLSGAYLSDAYLSGAYLSGAYLSGAYLSDANLSDANLRGANLSDKQKALVVSQRTIVPEEGDLIGFKKVYTPSGDPVVLKLLIPASAHRLGGVIERKCRASSAVVLEGSGISSHDSSFVYRQGETVVPTNGFDPDPFNVCAPGIHFFITRAEAEAY